MPVSPVAVGRRHEVYLKLGHPSVGSVRIPDVIKTDRPGDLQQAVPALIMLGAVVITIAACSPEVDGITGLTRDGQGRLVGLAQACQGTLVGASLIQDANTQRSEHVGAWVTEAPSAQMSWALQQPFSPNGWRTWRPGPQDLAPDHVYTLFAWREENVTNAAPLDFTAEDLATVGEGRVLISEPDAAGETHRPAVVSRDEFSRRACG